MNSDSFNSMVTLAAGALAGRVATTPEDAAKFAVECYEQLKLSYEKERTEKMPGRIG